jgi:hypothetical protein
MKNEPRITFSPHAGEPELIDQIILGLGLGSSGQQITISKKRPSFLIVNQTATDSNTLNRGKRSNCEVGQICQHVTTPHGKQTINYCCSLNMVVMLHFTDKRGMFQIRILFLQENAQFWRRRGDQTSENCVARHLQRHSLWILFHSTSPSMEPAIGARPPVYPTACSTSSLF